MKTELKNFTPARTRSRCAMTLVEVIVAMAIGSLVLAVIAGLTVFGARSFMALGNYSILDQQSRQGIDSMQRDIRQATAVVNWSANASSKWILFTNVTDGSSVKYSWDSSAQALYSSKTGLVLTNCTDWTFSLWQRTPQQNQTNIFYPASSPNLCKLINMTWKCQRSLRGTNLINSESIQTAQVVLRNQRSK